MLKLNRSLWLLAVAESISNLGSWITTMAIYSLVVFQGEGGLFRSSGILLAHLGPMFLLSPVAGTLCDRFDRKWIVIGSQLLSSGVIAALLVVDDLIWVYVLLMLLGVTRSVMTPARQAIVPSLAKPEALTQANALLQQAAQMTKIVAPMVGGAVVSAAGSQHAMLLDLLSYLVAATLFLLLPALPARPKTHAFFVQKRRRRPTGSEPVNECALHVVLGSPFLCLLFLAIFAGVYMIMGFDVLASVYTRDILQAGEQLFGVLVALIGGGSSLSVTWLMVRKGSGDAWREMSFGMFLLAAIPAAHGLGAVVDLITARLLVVAGCFLGGVGNGLVIVQANTLLQQLSPATLLGRVGGLFQSTLIAAQLIAILSTPLLVPAWLSMPQFFAFSTLELLLLGGGLLFAVPRLRSRQAPRPVADSTV